MIFPADAVHKAYEEGKKYERAEQNERYKTLIENVNSTAKDVVDLVSLLAENGIKPTTALLKINSQDNFLILIGIPEEDFIKDEYVRVYEIAKEIESRNRVDYYIRFTFIADDGNLDKEEIKADRFILVHKLFSAKTDENT